MSLIFALFFRFTNLVPNDAETNGVENKSKQLKEKRFQELRNMTEQQLINQIKYLKERAYR